MIINQSIPLNHPIRTFRFERTKESLLIRIAIRTTSRYSHRLNTLLFKEAVRFSLAGKRTEGAWPGANSRSECRPRLEMLNSLHAEGVRPGLPNAFSVLVGERIAFPGRRPLRELALGCPAQAFQATCLCPSTSKNSKEMRHESRTTSKDRMKAFAELGIAPQSRSDDIQ